ncbi:MAG: RNA polymerase sigma factor [Crocinitomicaceae bacterium]|nr:RNA polymerase sigma factor [Crocinitomicaceae bacterium]MBK8926033.1 RNA polymerase sigma factor [Crocinitomicaceae bacterium]
MSKERQNHFLQLYEPVHERFERFCRSRVYGEMDYQDVMNESLLIAYDKLGSLRSEKAFLGFLFGICVRVISNLKQKKKPENFKSVNQFNHLTSDDDPDLNMDIKLLYTLLNQLPEDQKECVLLFEIVGFSLKEIADIQSVSEGAIKQRLRRGREKLTELMHEVTCKNQTNYEK